jgi:hypothetical protein
MSSVGAMEMQMIDDEDDMNETTKPQFGSSEIDLAQLGLDEVAYIRRATIDNQQVWSIHAATGAPIGAATTFEQAWSAVKSHDLQPHRVN